MEVGVGAKLFCFAFSACLHYFFFLKASACIAFMIKVLLQILAYYGVKCFLVLGIGTGEVENSKMCEGL